MRIPLYKAYRAFPELDPFDDERCLAYVRTARRSHPWSRVLVWIVSAALVFPGTYISVLLVGALHRLVFGGLATTNWEIAGVLGSFALAVAAPLIAALAVGDLWLRRAIQRQLRLSSCPRCGYSLLGLRVSDGAVTCPECGDVIRLADIGLTPADVLAEPASALIAGNRT